MKNTIASLLGAIAAIAIGCSASIAQTPQNKEVVLRAVAFQSTVRGIAGEHIQEFARRVNKELAGSVKIQLLGSTEVIGYQDQPNAVRTGVVDIAFMSGSQQYALLPTNDYLTVTNLTPEERYGTGVRDLIEKLHNKRMNTHVLGEFLWPVSGTLYFGKLSNAALERLNNGEFKGLRMRGAASYKSLYGGLGIEGFPISPADIYTALERGTIDGYAFVTIDVVQQGWAEITKYRLDVTFNHASSTAQINLDKWNSLTDKQRNALDRIGREWQAWSTEHAEKAMEAERKAQLAAGINMISLSPDKKTRFLRHAVEDTWASLKQKLPELYAIAVPLEKRDRGGYIPEN